MMQIKEFVEKAGFPIDWKEVDVQNYIEKRLEAKGYRVKKEVILGGGRADIVARKRLEVEIIEVKKILSRESIFQAIGQATCYKEKLFNLGKVNIIIMGFAEDRGKKAQKAAISAADYAKSCGITVIFINKDPAWLPLSGESYWKQVFIGLQKVSFENLAIAAIAIMIVACLLNQQPEPNRPTNRPICAACSQKFK